MHRTARASLLSVVATALMITLNHVYSIGPRAFALGAVLVIVPTALLLWYRATKSRVAFAGYLLMNLWIVVGFGFLKGLWGTTLPLFLGAGLSARSTSYAPPSVGSLPFELGGVLTFVGSVFVLYYGVQLIRARRHDARSEPAAARDHFDAQFAGSVAIALIAAASAWTFAHEDRWVAPPGGVVRIGVIVPTTGPYALLGNSFVKAVQQAKDDLKGTKYRYELVLSNPGPDPLKARDVIETFIRTDSLLATLGGLSVIGRVTKPYAAAARIPHICVCTIKSIGDAGYNFTNIPSPEAEGVRWVQEAQRRGIRSVAMITQDQPSINGHANALKAEAARAELPIVSEQRFDASAVDFKSQIERAKASKPDVYYIEAFAPKLDLLAGQLAKVGIRNISSVVAPSLSDRLDLFEGVWYTDSNLRDLDFKTRFEERYPGTRFATHMMPYAYDSFRMIVAAFESGQNPAVYLRNLTTFDGTADRLTKRPGSGNFASTPAVWEIRRGRPTLIK